MTFPSQNRGHQVRGATARYGPLPIRKVTARMAPVIALALAVACVTDRAADHRAIDQIGEPYGIDSSGGPLGPRPVRTTPAVFAPCSENWIDAATRVSSTVLALGRTSGSPTREVAAALDELSRAIRVIAVRNPAADEPLQRIDRDAVLLENSDELDVGAPGWAADGLLASIDAIQKLGAGAHAHPWTDDARAATLAIDKGLMLTFQRGILQEAFRSTADALLIAAQAGARCDGGAVLARAAGSASR